MVEKKTTNRIRINFSTSEIEVESSNSSLDKVFSVTDTIARNLGRGIVDGENGKQRLSRAGIR